MEALHYSAIIKANLTYIKKELALKKADNPNDWRWTGEIKSEKPSILLIANKRWWHYWLNPPSQRTWKAMGEWEKNFVELMETIREELGMETECYAINDFTKKDIDWEEGNKPVLQSNPF